LKGSPTIIIKKKLNVSHKKCSTVDLKISLITPSKFLSHKKYLSLNFRVVHLKGSPTMIKKKIKCSTIDLKISLITPSKFLSQEYFEESIRVKDLNYGGFFLWWPKFEL
jgi:hypothetical protein